MASGDPWSWTVIGEGSFELDPLADSHKHVSFILFVRLLSTSLVRLDQLVGQGNGRRVSGGLTAPGHQRKRASFIWSYKHWGIWAFLSSSNLLWTPAPVNCSWHIRHCRDFHWHDRSTNGNGASAHRAGATGAGFRGGRATDCGNSRGDDNWTMTCREDYRGGMNPWQVMKIQNQ